MNHDTVLGKKVAILGSERSGMGAARLLSHFGAKVLLSELDTLKFSAEKRKILDEINAEFEFGYHSPDIFNSDFIVTSPGIPDNAEIIIQIKDKGIPIYSEVEVASWFINAPVIAVTGSNGKTTTVNLIYHLLRHAGYDAYLGGNVGIAISEILLRSFEESHERPVFVLEVSSFQLDHIDTFKPDIAVLLNLTPDHLDRYPSLNAYYLSKLRIFENQDDKDLAIINMDDAETQNHDIPTPNIRCYGMNNLQGCKVILGERQLGIMGETGWTPVLPVAELPVLGPHNQSNALAAIATVIDFIDDIPTIAEGLRTFKPVSHRLENIGQVNGIQCFNDSKATNIASTEVAIKSFDKPLWLILGGKDKGGDFSSIIPLLQKHVKEVLLIGAATEVIATQLSDQVPLKKLETIENAVNYALDHAKPGDVLLLSPACASFDQFNNYEARGKYFRKQVQQHEGWTK